MSHLNFFDAPAPLTLASLAAACDIALPADVDPSRQFRPVWPLERAGRDDVAFFVDPEELEDFIDTLAGACFVSQQYLESVPAKTIALVTSDPLEAFQRIIVGLKTGRVASSVLSPTAIVHADASLEQGVSIEPGAVVGPRVEIGTGTTIGANSVIGPGVRVGRQCRIDSHVSMSHALVGDGVRIEAGARIGMCSLDPKLPGSRAIPRVGRVIIQDNVEIGANAVVERGQRRDTIVGDCACIGALVLVAGGRTIDRCSVLRVDTFSSERKIG